MKGLLFVVFLLFLQVAYAAHPMTFAVGVDCSMSRDPDCPGRIDAVGVITQETPSNFKVFLEKTKHPPTNIRFNSPGGNLSGGIELGQIIRDKGFDTETFYCISACAYAFLGGLERRFVDDNTKFGVHRFYKEQALLHPTLEQFTGQDLDATQRAMAGLMLYLFDMGIDLRFLAIASQAGPSEIRWISIEEARDLKVVYQPDRWLPWEIKPYGAGLIAYSETADKKRSMRIACTGQLGGIFYVVDKAHPKSTARWFKQCAVGAFNKHPILGIYVDSEDVVVSRDKGAATIGFFFGSQQPTYGNSSIFNDMHAYPMACMSWYKYAGTTAGLKVAGQLALTNCVR